MAEFNKAPERIAWVDWAKVIGISLVVYAHVPNAPLSSIVFLFLMPFFFMISGWLYKPRPLKEEWKRTWRCLIVPYLIYNVGLLIITPPLDYKSVVYVLIGDQALLPGHFRAMWFLVALIIMRIVSSVIPRYMIHVALLSFFIAICLRQVGLFNDRHDVFQLQSTMLCYQYFVLGYLLHNKPEIDVLKRLPNRYVLILSMVISIVLLYLGAKYVGSVNLFRGQTGHNLPMMLIVSYGVSILLLKIFEITANRPSRIVKKLSMGTLFIVCTHQTAIILLGRFHDTQNRIVPVLITLIIILISYCFILLLDNYFPLLLGKNKPINK